MPSTAAQLIGELWASLHHVDCSLLKMEYAETYEPFLVTSLTDFIVHFCARLQLDIPKFLSLSFLAVGSYAVSNVLKPIEINEVRLS